jgi:hypothetical protein
MANFTALKTAINNAIKTNGNEEITGAILQAILDAMVETLGDSAINDLENAITTEVTNRENAVGGVADDLAAEALARANKDNQLDGRINQEEYNRANADAALSRTVDQGFQTLNSQMTALNAAISALNAAYQNGYLYGGIATPSSSPSNNKCFYIALQGGTYTNFGGVGVVQGINILKNDNGWKVEHIYDQTTLLNEFYLLRQQVIRAISSIDPIVIQGDVTNAPDEEDLTSDAQHLLKFKDRAYSPLNFSGLGMKILRKNILPLNDSVAFNGFLEGVIAEETLAGTPELIFWDRMNTRFMGIKDGVYYADWSNSDNYVPASTSLVYMYQGTPYRWDGSDFSVDETEVPNLVNCLTQDMINEANTIYIIRYDYTLKEDITIPANCVLQFDGGSIDNGKVTFQNTGIVSVKECFGVNLNIEGKVLEEASPEWFAGSDADKIERAVNIFSVVKLAARDYIIDRQIHILHSFSIKGSAIPDWFGTYGHEEITVTDFSSTKLIGKSTIGSIMLFESNEVTDFYSGTIENVSFTTENSDRSCDGIRWSTPNGPSRPVALVNCNFEHLDKAFYAYVPTGTTNISNLLLSGCNVSRNNWGIYAEGPRAIMMLKVLSCNGEANINGFLYSDDVSGGSVRDVSIERTLLEGQPSPINSCFSGIFEIKGCYFERGNNLMATISLTGKSSGSVVFKDNIIVGNNNLTLNMMSITSFRESGNFTPTSHVTVDAKNVCFNSYNEKFIYNNIRDCYFICELYEKNPDIIENFTGSINTIADGKAIARTTTGTDTDAVSSISTNVPIGSYRYVLKIYPNSKGAGIITINQLSISSSWVTDPNLPVYIVSDGTTDTALTSFNTRVRGNADSTKCVRGRGALYNKVNLNGGIYKPDFNSLATKTAANVTNAILGDSMFNGNKPVWYNGTAWVDATGATV